MLENGLISVAELCARAGIKVSALPYLRRKFPKQINPAGKFGPANLWREEDIERVKKFRSLLKFNPGRPSKASLAARKG